MKLFLLQAIEVLFAFHFVYSILFLFIDGNRFANENFILLLKKRKLKIKKTSIWEGWHEGIPPPPFCFASVFS